MATKIGNATSILRNYGPAWAFWRGLYELQLRSGHLQRQFPPIANVEDWAARALGLPASQLHSTLAALWVQSGGRLAMPSDRGRFAAATSPGAVAGAEAILQGRLRYFSQEEVDVGHPPDWYLAAVPGQRWPRYLHWARVPDLSPTLGDIKYVWEPSRFSHAFTLARAYARTGDDRYPAAFWTHLEDWVEQNPPELGPNWRCAQEMSLRSLAWLFALHVFRQSPATTPERIGLLIAQLGYHARHVERIHWFAARCVRNNHSISEAVGLFSVGTLLPFLPDAGRWQAQGLGYLAHEVGWQIYSDGSYVQHSLNYARMVADLLTWSISLARVNGVTLPPIILDRATGLLRFLLAMQDRQSGQLPNYGANDGTLLFPLSDCAYRDYRPSLGALNAVLAEDRTHYPPGPWDEQAAWFADVPPVLQLPAAGGVVARPRAGGENPTPAAAGTAFPTGGYFTLRGQDTFALIRCPTYRHRPSHADALHLDVWYHGQNILVDPGTFSYNLSPEWLRYFTGTAAHNTVSVDGRDQMLRGRRFMWLHWTRARLIGFESGNRSEVFEGEHYSYTPIRHRRKVQLDGDTYLVVDDLTGGDAGAKHAFRLHWLVNDFPLTVTGGGALIEVPGLCEPLYLTVLAQPGDVRGWDRAGTEPPRGWHSLHYCQRSPAHSFAVQRQGRSARYVTLLGPQRRVEAALARFATDPEQPYLTR